MYAAMEAIMVHQTYAGIVKKARTRFKTIVFYSYKYTGRATWKATWGIAEV
jgi:hypothetical protein